MAGTSLGARRTGVMKKSGESYAETRSVGMYCKISCSCGV